MSAAAALENMDGVLRELNALAALHRCPQCQRRGGLRLRSLASISTNAEGELTHRMTCSLCTQAMWIRCEDMGQHFRFNDDAGRRTFVYSISMAEEIVAGREPALILSPAQMADALRVNGSTAEMDFHWALSRDLSKPLIMIPSPVPHPDPAEKRECIIVIDGWHRMAKAVLMLRNMQAHRLTQAEADQCLACVTSLEGPNQ